MPAAFLNLSIGSFIGVLILFSVKQERESASWQWSKSST